MDGTDSSVSLISASSSDQVRLHYWKPSLTACLGLRQHRIDESTIFALLGLLSSERLASATAIWRFQDVKRTSSGMKFSWWSSADQSEDFGELAPHLWVLLRLVLLDANAEETNSAPAEYPAVARTSHYHQTSGATSRACSQSSHQLGESRPQDAVRASA